jgi:hypothetical protein
MQETFFIVLLSEINWNPVSDSFIVRCEFHWFFQESLDWNVVKVSLAFSDVSCSWDFWNFQTQTQLVFFVIEFCMETDEFFLDQIVFIFKRWKVFLLDLFCWELGPCRQFTAMLAVFSCALVSVCFFDGLFGFHLDCGFIFAQVFLKKETLKLSQDTLNAVSWRPPFAFLISADSRLDHVETDVISEDIGMRDGIVQCDSWWMIGVRVRELQFDVENASFIQSAFGPENITMPSENIMIKRPGNNTNSGNGFVLYFLKILNQTFMREGLNVFVNSCAKQSLISWSTLFFHTGINLENGIDYILLRKDTY